MLKLLLVTLIIVAVCIALLCIKILILPNGKFPNTHVGGNKAMAKRGIKCLQAQDADAQKKTLKKF